MNGSRITSEDKSFLSAAIGIGVLALLVTAAIYFFFFARSKVKDATGFDPNRPVPTDSVLRNRLSPEQFHIVRENGTETSFQNKYWNNTSTGLYVDVITGQPLFSSADKFDFKNGRVNFTKPLSPDLLVEKLDTSHDMQRTEVRTKLSDAHLGHVFKDGPPPSGLRYTVNSGALRLIPVEQLQASGYGSYAQLFPGAAPANPAASPNK